jgi:hypothetical protein
MENIKDIFKNYGLLTIILVLLVSCLGLDKWLSLKNMDKSVDVKFFRSLPNIEKSIGINPKESKHIELFMRFIFAILVVAIISALYAFTLKCRENQDKGSILMVEKILLSSLVSCLLVSFFGIYKPYHNEKINTGTIQVDYETSFWLYVTAFVLVIVEIIIVYKS